MKVLPYLSLIVFFSLQISLISYYLCVTFLVIRFLGVVWRLTPLPCLLMMLNLILCILIFFTVV